MSELVSIIVPTYNVKKYISETVECVKKQTYKNWELIITDDCSTDGTFELLQQFAANDSRIHIYQNMKNSGAGVARNNSIKHSNGRYIAFLDSDDWWYPTKLEEQIRFMTQTGFEFTFTAFEYADDKLNVVGVSHKPNKISKNRMLCGNNIGTPGVIYDTIRIGKQYMPEMRKSEDWALWIKLSQLTDAAYSINRPLWKYRTLSNTLSRNKWDLVHSNLQVYNEIMGYSKLKSLLMFAFVFIPNHLIKIIYNKIDSLHYISKIN